MLTKKVDMIHLPNFINPDSGNIDVELVQQMLKDISMWNKGHGIPKRLIEMIKHFNLFVSIGININS